MRSRKGAQQTIEGLPGITAIVDLLGEGRQRGGDLVTYGPVGAPHGLPVARVSSALWYAVARFFLQLFHVLAPLLNPILIGVKAFLEDRQVPFIVTFKVSHGFARDALEFKGPIQFGLCPPGSD